MRSIRRASVLLLALDALALTLFYALRHSRALMNFLTQRITQPLKGALAAVSDCVPFSVTEVLYAAAILWLLCHTIRLADSLFRAKKGKRLAVLGRGLFPILCLGATVWALFCLLWGTNYYADGFQQRSGFYAEDVATEDLRRVTEYFAARLNAASDDVPRHMNGEFACREEDYFSRSTTVYDALSREYPFLSLRDRVPKKMYFSRVMSYMNFTGFYFALTGESNINTDTPPCLVPATIAHELAHRRGIASEQECNFLAVLASTTCGDSAYAYSGWLLGYIHLSNALYRADAEAWRAVYQTLGESVRMDLAANNAYWRQFETPAADAVQTVYDSMLKGYGDTRGVQSYGAVVDLLVAYYKSPI